MKQEDKISRNIADSYKEAGPYLGLGTQLAATIVLMFFIGKWLDEKFETYPVLSIIFSFFGGFAGIYNFIKAVLNLNEKKKIEKNN
ncbi:MAG: AtpZ/AtpI family protein [Ignavibacterium sp.]|nr:MAG: AtpZ/AtpI family protein [Ignavibacterium sp.]